MSNFDDEKRNIEENLSENLTNTGKNVTKTGGKIAYNGAKKIGTAAGRKMFKRGIFKKTGALAVKGGKAVGVGLMNIGKFIIIGIKMFLAALISWGWIIIPVCLIIIIIWWLMPATRHFTLDGINKEATAGDTTSILSQENKALENYFQFYSDKVLNDNKVKITYKGIDEESSGNELFDELQEEEYIIGPFKPNKIVPPKQTSSSTGGSSSGNSSSSSGDSSTSSPNTSDYTIPKIEDIIKVQWFKGGENTLKIPPLKGNKLTNEQIEKYKFLVYDIKSGKTFYLVRTMGANHNDVEYASEKDASIMREALKGDEFDNWTVRPAFVIQGNQAIIATWTTRNHAGVDSAPGLKNVANRSYGYGYGPNYDNISNGLDGHMDLYFHGGVGHANPNKSYHQKPLENLEKQVAADKQKYLDLLNSNNDTKTKSSTTEDTIKKAKNTTTNKNSENSKITVMIDPGHGGTDSGAVKYVVEKDINLKVGLLVRENLEALGYNVIMSRETDKTLSYGKDRTQKSNNHATICISIHCNSGGGGSAKGIETFYPTAGKNTLASHIQSEVIKETNATNRGVKPASQTARGRIGILDNNKKPVALIELGFVDNKSEAELLKNSDYQAKLTKGIVNGVQNYFNNTPIDEIINSGDSGNNGSSGTTTDVYNVVDEMEGFISTSKDVITDKTAIKNETIDKMQSYWTNKAKPSLGLEWSPSDTKDDLNKVINDSYSIKPFEEIKKGNKEYDFDLDEDESKKIKDKYGREEYFRMTPELIYSLNQSLYKDEFIHSESLIKPVKINKDRMELDYNAFNANSGLSESEKTKYGLGTVFVYRPVITFKIEKGVEINQSEVSSEDGKYNSKATGRVIYNYDAKLDYVIDRAITFAGEYIFTYEEEINLINEQNIEEINYDSSKGIATGRLLQSKTYEVTEVPKSITFNDKGRSYIYNYLGAFNTEIPADIINNFSKQRLYDAFKYYENAEDTLIEEENGDGEETTPPTGGEGLSNVEQWRPLCEEIGKKWGIDPVVLLAFIHTESTGNLHASNGKYGGLCAMALSGGDIKDYFKDDPIYKNYTNKDIIPNCSSGHPYTSCEECERVARFNIEYTARRATAQMGLMLYSIYGKDFRTDILSDKEIQDAVLFTYAGYQTGEYGQMTIYDNYKDDPKLYSYPGTYYTSIWLKHYDGKCSCHSAGTALYSNKKNTASPYRTVNCVNRTYMEKGHKYYASYGNGVTFDKSVENYEYEQQKWFTHKGLPNKPGSGIDLDNSTGTTGDSYENEKVTEESVKYDMTLALNYAKYEKTGWFKNDDRYSTSLDENQIELTLANATAMKEELTVNEVQDGDYAFWDRDFLKDNFENGLPKGRSVKDYRNTLFSDKNWKKILDIVDYLERQVGQEYVPNVKPLNSSNLIGHAYKVYAGKSLPRTAKGIGDAVLNKVDEEDITLGDILILRPMNSHDSEYDILYPTETAICVGEDRFIMVRAKKPIAYSRDVINAGYDTLEIVRPLQTKKVKSSSNNSSDSFGSPNLENGTSPHPKGEWLWPAKSPKVSSPFGMRIHPVYGYKKMHTGIDVAKTSSKVGDDPIYAVKDGVVESVVTNISGYRDNSYGNQVVILHADGTRARYAHLAYGMVYVKKGDTVKQGDVIAKMGSTGTSTGIHLHFEIIVNGAVQDPLKYLTQPS